MPVMSCTIANSIVICMETCYTLFNDEREYYVERMVKDLLRKEWIENTISAAKEAIGEGRGFAAEYRIWNDGIRNNQHIIFAINEHEDGWDYYC